MTQLGYHKSSNDNTLLVAYAKLLMSGMGQKRTCRQVRVMSALPPTTDVERRIEHVCFVPLADVVGPTALLVSSIATP